MPSCLQNCIYMKKGNHGFGMKQQHIPTDTWIERFGDWLKVNGWLKLLHTPEWMKNVSEEQLQEWKKSRQKNNKKMIGQILKKYRAQKCSA